MEARIHKEMAKVEGEHWWFLARANIVNHLIEKYFKNKNDLKILEIGCGSGGNFNYLKDWGEIYAIEPDKFAFSVAKKKGLTKLIINDYFDKKYFQKNKFDLILLADVLEHIKDDKKILSEIKGLLSRNGIVLITVPAKKNLWSEHDIANHHFRRYEFSNLEKILKEKLDIQMINFMNFILYLPILIVRRIKSNNISKASLKVPHPIINNLMYSIFSAEKFILPMVRLPFGVSIIAICKAKK